MLPLVVLLAGCATRKEVVRFKQDSELLKREVQAVKAQNAANEARLAELDRKLEALREEQRRTRADVMAELSGLKTQTFSLDSKLEDTTSRVRSLLHRIEGRGAAADSMRSESVNEPMPEATDPEAAKAYDLARLDLSRGHYDLALAGFAEYLRRYPRSEYAVDAQYWIGEIYYAKEKYIEAAREFEAVLFNYPAGRKTAPALLKLGYCRIHLQDLEGARRCFESVMRRFPESQEAAVAAEVINELKSNKL